MQFAPTVLGARTAVLHIASNDPDEAPFNITLNGTGAPGIVFENTLTMIEEEAGTVDVSIIRTGSYSGAADVECDVLVLGAGPGGRRDTRHALTLFPGRSSLHIPLPCTTRSSSSTSAPRSPS